MNVSQLTRLTRPQIHFTPPSGWMNDPNGLIYHNGEYHLFYQHHPHSLVWGPMHWGHAVSNDLIHWEHLPVALHPYEKGFVFSGSAIVDKHNSAGFGENALVAIFTLHDWTNEERTDQFQDQGIAYSLDNGRSWTQYSGNPVIKMPTDLGHQEFRDPKVFWYGTAEQGHWVMILSVNDQAWLYTSPDLKSWDKASEFGREYGCHGSVWECPDLIEMTIEGSNESRWVLIVSVQDGSPAGGNGVQYFVGDFDGVTFTPHEAPDVTRWCDWGPDFYAAVTWENEPNGRRILIGWMNNWPYSHTIPADTWRGMLSFPRTLTLVRRDGVLKLFSQPIRELSEQYPLQTVQRDWHIGNHRAPILDSIQGNGITLNIEFDLNRANTADQFGLIFGNGETEYASIIYDVAEKICHVSRTSEGESIPKMVKGTPFSVSVEAQDGRFIWQIILDHHSLELFINGGEKTVSQLMFPNDPNLGVDLFAKDGEIYVTKIELASISTV